MAGTKRRSPTSTLVSKNSIEQASTILVGLPEKPKEIWSLREAIDALKDEITLALDRGYTYVEISKMLSDRGVEISASTLKYYLSSVRRDKDGGPRTRRRRRTAGSGISEKNLEMASAAITGTDEDEDEDEEALEEAPVEAPRRGRKPGPKPAVVAAEVPAEAPRRGRKPGPKPGAAKAKAAAAETASTTKATKTIGRGRRKAVS